MIVLFCDCACIFVCYVHRCSKGLKSAYQWRKISILSLTGIKRIHFVLERDNNGIYLPFWLTEIISNVKIHITCFNNSILFFEKLIKITFRDFFRLLYPLMKKRINMKLLTTKSTIRKMKRRQTKTKQKKKNLWILKMPRKTIAKQITVKQVREVVFIAYWMIS